jgi:hypothetical protein
MNIRVVLGVLCGVILLEFIALMGCCWKLTKTGDKKYNMKGEKNPSISVF